MRLLILSDLHHEVWRDRAPPFDICTSRPDAVILAGDIDTGAKAVAWADQAFRGIPVLYVHGNHEGYGGNLDEVRQEIDTACAATDHVTFLHDSICVIGGIRFLGAPLWTDFRLFGDRDRAEAMDAAEQEMSDYRRIKIGGTTPRALRASDTVKWHTAHRQWLAAQLSIPFEGRTVVITHMAPSIHSVSGDYLDDVLSTAYASRMDELVTKANLWVHGHMHESFDYRIGDCRVVCNPRGYPGRSFQPENSDFNPNFIVELG